MAINGIQNITVGSENQATGSDSLFVAFNKTQNNFTKLFSCASSYTNFVGTPGLTVVETNSNTVTFTNTGVTSLVAGTGVTLSSTTGDVTISATGAGGGAGVTNVGISSSTLRITNTPVVSSGIINIELPVISTPGFSPGEYIAPTLTVDQFGRINTIVGTTSVGTVTSVAVTAQGPGISVTGGPITSSGTITITNTGVTRINAGQGISVSSSNGNITIASSTLSRGTVTRVDISSSTLTIVNSPITQTGTIIINIPDDISLAGNLVANSIISNTTANITGNVNAGNLKTTGLLSVTGNASITGNLALSGNLTTDLSVVGNISGNNISGNAIVISTNAPSSISSGSVVGIKSAITIASAFGSSDYQNPASAQGVRGRAIGSNLSKTNNYITGVTGQYLVTGTNASNFPKVGILGVVGDQTTTADAAIMAFLDGDGGTTTAGAAFKVGMINSTASSGFNFGLDLQWLNTSVPSTTQSFKSADIRLNNGLMIKSLTTAVTDGASTTLAVGTMVVTSNATGVGKMFISNGTILKQLAFLTP
jgi:hypothetical protein